MLVNCLNCGKEFDKLPSQIKRSPNHFCCKSCAAKRNNQNKPKKQCTNECKTCGCKIWSCYINCKDCIEKNKEDNDLKTIEELLYHKYKSAKYGNIRSRARTKAKNLGMIDKGCAKCGYKTHVEVCHIKSICEFELSATIGEVNSEDNLICLCPTHHWELDNGYLQMGP